ncbi:MAG: hypothetical protein M1820_000644 [Bogoriella megaspora]|nr:MAG: hypothetical protein M1820_000644 [Bogoriella megaspora]
MAKKKKSQVADSSNENDAPSPTTPSTTPSPSILAPKNKFGEQQPSTSALIICRNKHWRYISSFHGPWLQLPPEVLETLAHSNYFSPRPHPVDPAVFYDIVKIRKAVDDATNLAVRATNGVASSALNNSLNAGNGMLGGGNAAALGLGYGGGGNAKLSRERKYRMRELATQKLSYAYYLDEIAASVATMQSASSVEDVASHVLQRNANDPDGKYVHFFHEKIPSRMMAECTPLDPLDDVIAQRPIDGEPFRTRALTRLFKDDYVGAAKDLTDALTATRYKMAQHRAGRDQLILASAARAEREKANAHGSWRQDQKLDEEDHPSSLETQILFHRGGVYLTLACQQVDEALDAMHEAAEATSQGANGTNSEAHPEHHVRSPAEQAAHSRHLDARKAVKTNAKRALRDYMGFLEKFEYTPGLPVEIAEEFVRRVRNIAVGPNIPRAPKSPNYRALENGSNGSLPEGVSNALVPRKKSPNRHSDHHPGNGHINGWPGLPPNEIHQASALFAATPPASLPPYPAPDAQSTLSLLENMPQLSEAAANALQESQEAITYHPLLTDALHSLLLCHALLQTSPKELLRHAHNAARLARVCDGYPVFLAARSPSRADWIEVIRRAGDWIGLRRSWESLCKPAPLPTNNHPPQRSSSSTRSSSTSTDIVGPNSGSAATATALTKAAHAITQPEEAEEVKRERRKQQAIMDALADERVVDEASFQQAVRAREKRAIEDEEQERGGESPYLPLEAPRPGTAPAKALAEKEEEGSGGVGENVKVERKAEKGKESSTGREGSSPPAPKRWAQEDGKEYPISTERAEAIARWVREAPLTIEGVGRSRKGARKGRSKKAAGGKTGLEGDFEGLGMQAESGRYAVEEEVD